VRAAAFEQTSEYQKRSMTDELHEGQNPRVLDQGADTMNIAPKLTCTVLAAACLVGLSGLASAASAAETTTASVATSSALGADANLQASRHFTVTNNSSDTLVVNKVFFATDGRTSGSLPEDSYPADGTVLKPGQSLPFEVHAWADHAVNVVLTDASGRMVVVYLLVSGGTQYPTAQNEPGTGAAFTFTPQPSIGLMTISDPQR
jgi:hypothetical protein